MQYLNMPKKESIHKEFYYNNNIISFFNHDMINDQYQI